MTRSATWLFTHPILWIILISCIIRLPILMVAYGPDPDRYLAQAQSMLDGHGFGRNGAPDTKLMPGYPIFLATIMLASSDHAAIVGVQFGLSVLGCVLLYLTASSTSKRLGLFASFAMAAHLWSARFVGFMLSETFSFFLSSLLVYLVGRYEREDSKPMVLFFIAFMGMFEIFTAPATMTVIMLCLLAISWKERARPRMLASLLVGASLVLIPWFTRCYLITHRPASGLDPFQLQVTPCPGLLVWYRTWATNERDLFVFWNEAYFKEIPDWAFKSPTQRAILTEANATINSRNVSAEQIEECSKLFLAAAEEQTAERCLRSFTSRLATLLFVEPRLGLIPKAVSWKAKVAAAILPTLYALYGILYLFLISSTLLRGSLTQRAVALGVVAYFLLAASTGSCEVRRNIPFIPFILSLVSSLAHKRAPSATCRATA